MNTFPRFTLSGAKLPGTPPEMPWTKTAEDVLQTLQVDPSKGLVTLAIAQLWHVFNVRSKESTLLNNAIVNSPFV